MNTSNQRNIKRMQKDAFVSARILYSQSKLSKFYIKIMRNQKIEINLDVL